MTQDIYLENLLFKAAWYYYKENMTQNEIAVLLDLSRAKVVRLLEKARTEGIVSFEIKGLGKNGLGMETELKELFKLTDAFIIPSPPHVSMLSDSLSKAAAQYLQNKLQPQDMVALGWGRAISKTIDYLSLQPESNISVVTLTGGVNYYLHNRSQNEGGMEKFQDIHVIPAPFLASTEEMAESFLSEPSIKGILDLALLAKYIIIGIGGIYPDATIIQEEKMTLNELTYIRHQQAVGDILGQFFDRRGVLLPLPHHKRLIGTPLDSLKGKKVVAIAGGERKLKAIHGALTGGYIHTLVTDETTAVSLLNMEVKSKNGIHSGL